MEWTLTQSMIAMAAAVAVLLQVIKNIPATQKAVAYFPVFAIVIAFGFSYAANMEAEIPMKLQAMIMQSIVVGLTAAGGYDAIKRVAPKKPS